MIDESPVRIRYEAVRSSLDERGRRLAAAAEAKAAGYGGIAATARDEGRAKYDRTRSERPARSRFVDREDTPRRRGQSSVDDQGPDSFGRPSRIARARDDG